MGEQRENATELVSRRVARRLGRYMIVEELAKGGMAQLYIARRDGAREICVLKRLLGELETDETASKRFQREAVVASRLDHPNIARLLDASVEGGVFCIATEFIPGLSLEQICAKLKARGERLPIELAIGIIRRILDALGHAHDIKDEHGRSLDIVHRDLSPRNLLVSYAGEVKIIDFGVAHGRVDEFKTAPGVVVGSLEYMSPEQALSHSIDRRSDLYTTAVVLYEILSGTPVVRDEKLMDLLAAIVRDQPPPLQETLPDLPDSISIAINRALEKSPDDRFQSAAEFRFALSGVPLITNQALSTFMRSRFADEEREVIALLERAKQSFETELEDIARPPAASSPERLAQYEPTALVNRKRARAGQRDRMKLPAEDLPSAAYVVPVDGSKTSPGSEITKLGAIVLEMPGEPAPLARNSVVRVQLELLRRSNLFLRIVVIVLGIVATGLGIAAYMTISQKAEAPAQAPRELAQESDTPAVVSRSREGGSDTIAADEPPGPAPKKKVEEHARHEETREDRGSARSRKPSKVEGGAVRTTGNPSGGSGSSGATPAEKAEAEAPASPPNPHAAEIAKLRRMVAELKSGPLEGKRFDQVSAAILEAAKNAPPHVQALVKSDLTNAELQFEVDLLAHAVELIARAKSVDK